MSWIALREAEGGLFRPGGLNGSGEGAGPVSPDAILARGSLQLQCSYAPGTGAAPLLHYEADEPWHVCLSLFFDANGTLVVGHRVGARAMWFHLRTSLTSPADSLIITYGWNAPDRIGLLSIQNSETGQIWLSDVPSPMPLSNRDVGRLAGDGSSVNVGQSVAWFAVADHKALLCPPSGVDGRARVALKEGREVRFDQLSPGDEVVTADGQTAQIRWVGMNEVIARGGQAPVMLRAPFHGLKRDIVVSADQRLTLAGSNVEYTFGVEEVSAAAGHLMDQRSVLRAPTGAVVRYWQALLDRPAAMVVDGCALDSIDPGPFAEDPWTHSNSVLASIPLRHMPEPRVTSVPLLQSYEATSLAYSGAA